MITLLNVCVFAIALVMLLPLRSPAQWVQTNGPYGGHVLALAVSGTDLFAGTIGNGVCLSTNNGTGWTAVSTGLPNPYVYSLAISGKGGHGEVRDRLVPQSGTGLLG